MHSIFVHYRRLYHDNGHAHTSYSTHFIWIFVTNGLIEKQFFVIDKLHTTEVITHTRGGCANRHRGEAEASICCITTECICDNLSSVYFIWIELQL